VPPHDEGRQAVSPEFFTVNKVQDAPDLDPLWGNWLFRGSVVIQAGEPGISKTTFNYTLAKALVDGEKFLGVKPVKPTLQVLYIDWESSKSLIKSRMRMIGYPKNCDNFVITNDPEVQFIDVDRAIDSVAHILKPDVIFADPLRLAFNMRDENDNAEASRQAKYFRELAKRRNCAVVVVHHSSKAELSGTKKASGGYARTGLADIVWNFERLPEDFDQSIFKFSIPKNREIDDQFTIFVKKDGGVFVDVQPPSGYTTAAYESSIKHYTCQQRIQEMLGMGLTLKTAQILKALNGEFSEISVKKALGSLVQLGIAMRTARGEYCLDSHKPEPEQEV